MIDDGTETAPIGEQRRDARRDALVVMVAAIAAAAINYLLSLVLIRILPGPELARYVALSGAALVVGNALGSGLPAAIGVAHARGEHAGADRFAAVGSSRVDLQACKLEYSIVSPK